MQKLIQPNKRAFVLILTAWLLIVITLTVLQMVRRNSGDIARSQAIAGNVRARWAAHAGVNYAIAALLDDDRQADFLSERIFSDTSFNNHALGEELSFTIGAGVNCGIIDESAKLSLYSLRQPENVLSAERNNSLVQQAEKLAVEADLVTDYNPAQIPDIRQIASNSGIALAEFYGEDINGNNMLDWNENDGDISFPPDNEDGILQTGSLNNLTVSSFQENCDSKGRRRVNINTATAAELSQLEILSQSEILWLLSNRPFASRGELFRPDITPSEFTSPIDEARRIARINTVKAENRAALTRAAQNGQDAIIPEPPSSEVVRMLFDMITVSNTRFIPGQININTAGTEVIVALTGLEDAAVDTLLDYRKQLSKGFSCEADIFAAGILNYRQMVSLVDKLTLRSNVFSIISTGKCQRSGRQYQIQVLVSRYKPVGGNDEYRILSQSGGTYIEQE